MELPKIDKWLIYGKPPRCGLMGTITNDKRFGDGKFVQTSKLIRLDLGGKRAQTMNTLYELGEPSPSWIRDLPEGLQTLNEMAETINNNE